MYAMYGMLILRNHTVAVIKKAQLILATIAALAALQPGLGHNPRQSYGITTSNIHRN